MFWLRWLSALSSSISLVSVSSPPKATIMTKDLGSCDYLVIGSGAMGLAFVDTLLTLQPEATVVLVDRHAAPGGHWNDDYDFVKLHQPSLVYGVASKQLEGNWMRRLLTGSLPWTHRASKPEIVKYYQDVVDGWIAKGQLQYFPSCDYDLKQSSEQESHTFTSLLDKNHAAYRVLVKVKFVDAVQGEVMIPATTPPNFAVDPGINLVTPNEIFAMQTPDKKENHSKRYVVIGCGKTGMDTIVYLQTTLKVAAEHLTWIIPRDVWIINRNRAGPSRYHQALLNQAGDHEAAMDELQAQNLVFRLDPDVRPSAPLRFPTVSPSELTLLRKVHNKIRQGRIASISIVGNTPQLRFQDGSDLLLEGFDVENTVFIHCSSPGPFNERSINHVFDQNKVTLFALFPPPIPLSGATIARLETARRHQSLDLALANQLLASSSSSSSSSSEDVSLDGTNVLKHLVRPYLVGSPNPVHHLDVLRNVAVFLAIVDKDPTVGANWLTQGNRVSEYNWISKLQTVENLQSMVDKSDDLGYTEQDVQVFQLLSKKLEPLKGR